MQRDKGNLQLVVYCFEKASRKYWKYKLHVKSLWTAWCQRLSPEQLPPLRNPVSLPSLLFTELVIEKSEGELLWSPYR